MKKRFLFCFIVVLCTLILSATNVIAQLKTFVEEFDLGSENNPAGNFCQVEKVNVCVVTKSVEDCLKLNGKKVDACPETEKTK